MSPERLAQLRSDYRDHGYMLEVLAHLDTLTAERDELAAAIANEKGEGPPPSEGWAFSDLAWRSRIGIVWRASTGRWTWSVYINGDNTLAGRANTAREGMRMCMAERARLDALAAVPTTTAPEVPRAD